MDSFCTWTVRGRVEGGIEERWGLLWGGRGGVLQQEISKKTGCFFWEIGCSVGCIFGVSECSKTFLVFRERERERERIEGGGREREGERRVRRGEERKGSEWREGEREGREGEKKKRSTFSENLFCVPAYFLLIERLIYVHVAVSCRSVL